MGNEQIESLLERMGRIEAVLCSLVQEKHTKERYTTAEVADMIGKAEYTVREWCRQRRVDAEKKENGRGWLIPHAELTRIRNGERPLPIPKY